MKFKTIFCILLLLASSSCGYRFTSDHCNGQKTSLSIPYIQGDSEALFNNQLVNAFSRSGRFDCLQSGGDTMLQVVLMSDSNDRVGYRYDRDRVSGRRRQNILGVENRRKVTARVTLYDSLSGDVIFGPTPISAFVDYDYVDPGSPRDLNTTTSYGTVPTIRYSYGQLNTVEGAHDDASVNLYAILSQKILETITNHLFKE